MVGTNALGNTPPAMKAEATAILTAAGLVTIAAFTQAEFPATFLPCIAVLAAPYRLAPFGPAAGMLSVPIITPLLTEIGRAPCRESVWQYVWLPLAAFSLTKNHTQCNR